MGAQSDDEEAFLNAFDRVEAELIAERSDGVGRLGEHRRHRTAEARRVSEMLARDRADAAAERYRREAEIEVEAGRSVMMADAVVPPTREQMASGAFQPYTPRQPDGTVRLVSTYRRRELAQVQKLVLSGTIDAQGFRDCRWYRKLHETTGLTGRIGSVDYGREVFVEPQARAMFADHEVEAQDTFRFIRSRIAASNLLLLDPVVLLDVPIWRAARTCGAGWRRAKAVMANAVHELGTARKALSGDS